MEIKDLKDKIIKLTDEKSDVFNNISNYIFNNPENPHREYKSKELLVNILGHNKFKINSHIEGIETGFIGEFSIDVSGPTLGVIVEYWGSEKQGHLDGNNLQSAMGIGSVIILKELMEEFSIPGKLKIFGVPGKGGKLLFFNRGLFDGIDGLFYIKPGNISTYSDITYNSKNYEVFFTGKNSLNGIIQLFNGINSIKETLEPFTYINGIIKEGGENPEVQVLSAKALFNIKALGEEDLKNGYEKLYRCIEGSSLMIKNNFNLKEISNEIKSVVIDNKLSEIFKFNLIYNHEQTIERNIYQKIGIDEIGNISREIPVFSSYLKLKDKVLLHSEEFKKYSEGIEGELFINKGIKILSMSLLDKFLN
ncbi:MAG: hypothetical protein MJH09_07165 [Cetobacterium sp.]|nr:hypothetical protein [Cetobacterium sp.]